MKRTLLAFISLASFLVAQDTELTNYKNGIDVTWGGTKGTDYMEEYCFSDKLINDTKVVFLRDTTTITMAHNANNLAAFGGKDNRGRASIGAFGPDGDAPRVMTGVVSNAAADTFTYVGHGLVAGQVVRYVSGFTELNVLRPYHVVSVVGDTFKLAVSFGGAAINITTDSAGTLIYDDEGVIRYDVDRLWNKVNKWSGSYTYAVKPEYTGPFTLGGITYDGSTAVVGTTGGNGYAQTDKTNFYWRGLTETVGAGTEEYHILMVADDDRWMLNNSDSSASDGKYYVLVVNPITPAMTVRATGEGKFYTTPAWTYWVPKIHAQTTYFEKASGTGTVTFELTNIYGGNISYRINGGSTVDVGAATVTLAGTDFADGTSTLEYWYTATPTVIRTRTVVKNPTHPSLAETHGNLLWPEAYWDQVASRVTRSPYKETWNTGIRGKMWESVPLWNAKKRRGYKLCYQQTTPYDNGLSGWMAMFAKNYGATTINSGQTQSYGALAKEMLMESPMNQHTVGMEVDNWAAEPMPCADTVYRGYRDANIPMNDAVAYDLIASIFRSDQATGGLTPVEDYFVRDMLASWPHGCAVYKGGFANPSEGGMWPFCRDVGAILIGAVMPTYSTPYYGTSGFDGVTTTVYSWAPFQTTNYTWKKLFLVGGYTANTGQYSTGPVITGDPLINDPAGTLVPPGVLNHTALWGDRLAYLAQGNMNGWIELFKNMANLYDPGATHTAYDLFLADSQTGSLYGAKINNGEPVSAYGPTFVPYACLYNSLNPATAAAGALTAATNTYASGKDVYASMSFNLFGPVYYDDTYFGGADVTAPTVTITGPTSSPTYDTTTGILTLSGTASDNVSVALVSWSNDRGVGGTATGTTSWTVPLIALEGVNVITVRSQDSSGNLSTPDTITVTYTPPVETPPGSSTTTHTNPRNRLGF